jgi:hypothetical protein
MVENRLSHKYKKKLQIVGISGALKPLGCKGLNEYDHVVKCKVMVYIKPIF